MCHLTTPTMNKKVLKSAYFYLFNEKTIKWAVNSCHPAPCSDPTRAYSSMYHQATFREVFTHFHLLHVVDCYFIMYTSAWDASMSSKLYHGLCIALGPTPPLSHEHLQYSEILLSDFAMVHCHQFHHNTTYSSWPNVT